MSLNCVAFVGPSSLLSFPSLSPHCNLPSRRYCLTRLAKQCYSNSFSCRTRRQRCVHCTPRCSTTPDPDDDVSDDSVSQPPQDKDWRAFRARLVRNENTTSDTSLASESPSSISTSPTSHTQSTSDSQLWAHHIPFVEAGSLLLASPEHFCDEYACTFFANTAILILDHSDQGSLGVIINRPIIVELNTAMKPDSLTDRPSIQVPGIYRQPQAHLQQLQSSESSMSTDPSEKFASESDLTILNEAPVFNGGPVRLDTLLLLHGDPEFGDAITGAVRTAPFHSAVVRYREGALPDARFFVGYTGWSSGQLEQEINEGVWYTCACCDEILLTHWPAGTNLHRLVLPLMGGHYAQVAKTLQDDNNE